MTARADDHAVRFIPDPDVAQGFTVRVGSTDQSYVDLDDPARLEFDYVQRMADVIDAHADPGARLRVVHVGGAGFTLPRYVAHTRPHSVQIVLEPDAELTEFVRLHLPLVRRSGIKIRGVAGRPGVTELREAFADLLVVDAFAGPRVPADLTTKEFLADAARVLASTGTFMINITDRAPFGYARRVVAGVREAFRYPMMSAEPATLKGRRFGNVLVVGAKAPLPLTVLTRSAAQSAFPYRVVHGARLSQLIGGGLPFTEADAEMSPDPPGGLTHFT